MRSGMTRGVSTRIFGVAMLAIIAAALTQLICPETAMASTGTEERATLFSKLKPDRDQIAIDVGVFSVSVSYARRVHDGFSVGAGAGGGPDLVNFMIVAGDHFSESTVHEGYGRADKSFQEWFYANAFARYQPSEHFLVDLGFRTSVFLHYIEWDDDPASGRFTGGYIDVMAGWRRFKIGSRLTAGEFVEGREVRESGVNLVPLFARFVFP